MRQAVMTEPGKIAIGEVEAPQAGPGQVLLKVKRIGVCGSDIHVYHGLHPFTSYPVVQGHEFSGEIVAVGEGVEGVNVGRKATARPQVVCGQCKPCRRGDYNICDVLRVEGFQTPGCAQDYFLTTPDKLVLLPDSLSFEQGALVEPVSVACHSTARASKVDRMNVVVLGAGTIGNLVAQVVRCRGAKKILITDLSDFRLDIARQCGIENVSNAGKESLADAAKRVFGDEGFNLAFEAAGAEATMSAAVENIEKGSEIVVLGVFGEKPRIDMSVVGDREHTLIGTLMYKHEDYLEAVKFISEGKIITEPLVTKHFAFEEYLNAYKFIEKQGDKTMKVMIDL